MPQQEKFMWSEILLTANGIADIIVIGGYITYKRSPKIPTWEAGCSKVAKGLIDWIQEEASGQPPEDKIVYNNLRLTKEELRELTKQFVNSPYLEPCIIVTNQNDTDWYDLTALGLAKGFENISLEELRHICHRKIRLYFDETREWIPDIYIFVASPVRLHFAVALSKEASRRLAEQQEQFVRDENLTPPVPDVLEEEIDLWEDIKEQENEDRL